tara:strand:+ start:18 stop:671 length:654 start_codon:yes stop_codon:yes gene_type:complete
MMSNIHTLPIFPLNTVLFPFETMPLRIFEDRYKKMLQDSLNDNSKIGIALIKYGNEVGGPAKTYDIGTVAEIKSSERTDSDEYYLVLEGIKKFLITRTVSDTPYITAEIKIIEESYIDSTIDSHELSRAKLSFQNYINYLLNIQGEWKKTPPVPNDPIKLSYLIPQLLNLKLPEKQHFLEVASSKERIDASLHYLNSEIIDLSKKLNAKMNMQYGRN